ncbi:Hsp90 beta [Fimicolochytrium jonesii]|uniref:Hsp90 beta n=1 Tax=Fimicolochytrium jonesii TaxID=1396493 RepID=UPI0022FE8BEB|nr:Hsp90 beta [Fimicolochytrium jonesii]KAI8816722.1 Hsp90 beta [Fimicolochytrium jonesii]
MKLDRFLLLVGISVGVLLATFATLAAAGPEVDVGGIPLGQEVLPKAPPGSYLTPEDQAKLDKGGEKYQFEAEVNRMMKLIINSLYKTKEIFLRELISNASDALDKIRFKSLQDKTALGENTDLKITIVADKEGKTLTLTDTGVGMTKADLKTNLGTIAKSGTADFISTMEHQKNGSNLIGQFGVGFYSAFLVADRVTVISKNNADKQYIWESTSESDFRIIEDPRGNTLGRGTQIVLHLKDEALEYISEKKLRELVKHYSEFINFPIYLWSERTETEQVPIEEEEAADDMDDTVEDVTEKKDDSKPKFKEVSKHIAEWELINNQKPIWTRRPSTIQEEEYNDFYKAFAKDTEAPLAHNHFRAEGEVEFQSIIFIPKRPSPAFLQSGDDWTHNLKLFVRRVFITDELPGFLPRWLSFLKGLVDSDEIPLNVSRETLQQHAILKVIKKKVIAKAIDMMKSLASKDTEKYLEFFTNYGNAIKLGIIEDASVKKKLVPLLRFRSSHDGNYTSLEDYYSRMRKGQPQIYFITGQNLEEFMGSPFVERLIARGYEVLYFLDPIDEYLSNALVDYKYKKLQHVGKAGLKYGDEDEKSADKIKEQEEEFQPLKDYLKERLSKWVDTVKISHQLTTSPCAVLSSEYGVSGTMERILQAQALGNKEDFRTAMYLNMKKVFEINPDHPLIIQMLAKVKAGKSADLDDSIYVLFESTAIASGFAVRNATEFAKKVENVVRQKLGVDLDKVANVEVAPAPAVEDAKEKDAGKEDDIETSEEGEKIEEVDDGHDEL